MKSTRCLLAEGTPSHLPPAQLAALVTLLGQWLPLAAGGEFSVEANPADLLEEGRLWTLAEAGVTRVSVGVQSFNSDKLKILERRHDADSARRAVRMAKQAVRDVSLDLIFGVPGETPDVWHRDLQSAVALQPDHVSTYGLTFEKGAAFWSRRARGQLASVDEEQERQMYLDAIGALGDAGFEHYEVSNFARPGRRCRHNLVYWQGASYLAFGPGAARHLDGRREVNHRSTTTYIRRLLSGGSPVAEREQLDAEARARERLVFGLRLLQGVDKAEFLQDTGFDADILAGAALQRHASLGLLHNDLQRVRLTTQGLLVSDSIWPDLL